MFEPNGWQKDVLFRIIEERKNDLKIAWIEKISSDTDSFSPQKFGNGQIALQIERLLTGMAAFLSRGNHDDNERLKASEIAEMLTGISVQHAKIGVPPVDTAFFVLSLKSAILPFLREATTGDPHLFSTELLRADQFIDRLALITFDAYSRTREEVIAQQSRSIMELSTPAVKLWDKILLLPLIGVVDTVRASQVIESLLQAIFDTESLVAILDITGVPLIDTRVAHHLIKTIAAAKMLGAEVIVTGISPDTAQTMVKLNIDLGAVRTCGTLRTGVAEAFKLVGKNI